jgi:predicted nucleic acid-binding protein
LPIEAADHEARLIETRLDFLPDTAAVHEHWRRLVVEYRVSGRQVHDARLVAVMLAHGILRLLTLNVGDFERYGSLIAPVHPRELAQDVEAR